MPSRVSGSAERRGVARSGECGGPSPGVPFARSRVRRPGSDSGSAAREGLASPEAGAGRGSRRARRARRRPEPARGVGDADGGAVRAGEDPQVGVPIAGEGEHEAAPFESPRGILPGRRCPPGGSARAKRRESPRAPSAAHDPVIGARLAGGEDLDALSSVLPAPRPWPAAATAPAATAASTIAGSSPAGGRCGGREIEGDPVSAGRSPAGRRG